MPVVLIENFRAVFYAPFYAACALGAYEAEGLDVELKLAAELGKALQEVTAGAGQVSWGDPLRVLAALDQDPACGYCAFWEVVGRDPFFLIGRTPNPGFAPSQLPHWTLAAVTEVPTPWICLQHDLRRAAIAPSAVKLARWRTMAENAAARLPDRSHRALHGRLRREVGHDLRVFDRVIERGFEADRQVPDRQVLELGGDRRFRLTG